MIPINLNFHKVVQSFDFIRFKYKTVKQNVTVSMVTEDQCLPHHHNNPMKLVRESPLFKPDDIRFGETVLKHSQYIDAHQRATFWQDTDHDKNGYHLNLKPTFTSSLEVNVPGNQGLAVDGTLLFGNQVCGSIAQVNFFWFDNYLRKVVIPKLTADGLVSPTKTPVLLIKSLGLAFDGASPSRFALGYHDVIVSGIGAATKLQTYMVSDFGAGAITYSPTDVQVLTHEIGEWVNDPFINNVTPEVDFGICMPTLTEIGDFQGGNVATHVSPNGYTYHLQEMAFIPWFFGGASPSINGWYSSNGSFTTPFVKQPCS